MGARNTRPCGEAGCTNETHRWRQCPNNACRTDIAFCEAHGGDERAVAQMEAHIQVQNPAGERRP